MESRLKLRLEAARLAAQLSPTSVTDLVKQAKTIEKYLLKNRTENISMEKKYRQCHIKLAEDISSIEDLKKTQIFDKLTRETESFLPDTVLAVNRQHDPEFRRRLMQVFSDYPSTGKDLNEAARQRQELYHDMGLAPEPFDSPNRRTERPTAKGMTYLAPGGMPSSEGESIYLQQDGEKVE